MKRARILDAIELQKNMLSVTGSWPKRQKSTLYRMRQIFSWTVDITFYSTLLIELHLNIVQSDYKHLTELISFMASPTSYLFKHFIFVYNARKVMDTLDKIENPLFQKFPAQSDKHLRSTQKYATIMIRTFQFFVLMSVILFFLKPFFTKDLTAIRFAKYDLGAWLFPFHCYQVFSIGLACWNNSTLDVLALGLISIGSAQFEVLRDKLFYVRDWAGLAYEEIDNGEANEFIDDIKEELDRKVEESLKDCVKHHLAIIDYATDIESIYTYYFLIQFFDSVIAICNTWFQFMLADDLLNIAFLIFYTLTLTTQLGIYCIYGNSLMLRSSEIRDACYMSNWYNCGVRVRKILILIMERSKRPTVLTAGKFSVLSLQSYSNLLQSTYSYFALMKHLYGK